MVPGPCGLQPHCDVEHRIVLVAGQRFNAADRLARAADPPEQRHQRGGASTGEQQSEYGPERHQPIAAVDQDDGVKHQHQIDRRHQAMRRQERPVGKPLPEREHHQCQQQIEAPFAEIDGDVLEIAKRIETGDDLRGPRRPRRACQPAELRQPARADFQQPVNHCEAQSGNAEPFVQAIKPVEAAQRAFDLHRARRQYDAERHRSHREHARQVDQRLAPRPEIATQRSIGNANEPQPDQQAERYRDD